MNRFQLFSCIGLLGASFAAQAGFTDFDTSFGTGGMEQVTSSPAGSKDELLDVAQGSDGNLYVYGAEGGDHVVRLSTDGAVDTSFGNSGYLSLSQSLGAGACAILVDVPDKVIYVSGVSQSGNRTIPVEAFDFSGNLISSFGTSGVLTLSGLGTNARPTGLQLLASGEVLLVGTEQFADSAGNTTAFAAEFNANGVLLGSFGNGGVATITVPGSTAGVTGELTTYKSAVDTAGRVYIAGGSGGSSGLILRLTASGQPDSTFGSNGVVAQVLTAQSGNSEFELVTVQSDGSIVVFGSSLTNNQSNSSNGFINNQTAVLNTFSATGAPVASSAANTSNVLFYPNYLLQADGKIVIVSGDGTQSTSASSPNIVRLLGFGDTGAGGGTSGGSTGGTTGGTSTGGTTGGTTASSTGGTSTGGISGTSAAGSGGSGAFSPWALLLGLGLALRRKFLKK